MKDRKSKHMDISGPIISIMMGKVMLDAYNEAKNNPGKEIEVPFFPGMKIKYMDGEVKIE